jgi:hypothetical protein
MRFFFIGLPSFQNASFWSKPYLTGHASITPVTIYVKVVIPRNRKSSIEQRPVRACPGPDPGSGMTFYMFNRQSNMISIAAQPVMPPFVYIKRTARGKVTGYFNTGTMIRFSRTSHSATSCRTSIGFTCADDSYILASHGNPIRPATCNLMSRTPL